MKVLIPKNQYGVFADTQNTARVDSLFVADYFGKNHKEVVRDIRRITAEDSGLSLDFNKRNFALINYRDSRNRIQPAYAMTRDGFVMLVMGYTGKKGNGDKRTLY